ncbi:excisionase family DNA-binding protein [Bremerella volcania]
MNKLKTAKLFDTTDRTISEWVRTRGMPHLKIGSLIRFHRPTVEQWALAQMQGDVPTTNEKSPGEGPAHPGQVSASNPSDQAGETTDDHPK